jgi:hypothetical protein
VTVVERVGGGRADLFHFRDRAVGLLAVIFERVLLLLLHFRRTEHDVGGKPPFRIHVARDVADGADDFQPLVGIRDPVHRPVFGRRDVHGKAPADGRQREDNGGQKGADFHGNSSRIEEGRERETAIAGNIR